ncbi:MAG: HAMP domain-containing histidine kinase [Gammaproteobacteria bacterium]|nr:HAMP domain-containing histidine kinase [Gammaproteobacteria bacterium]
MTAASGNPAPPPVRLLGKLGRAFLIQAGLIALTAILSILAARVLIGDVMVRAALEDESDYFWERHAEDPAVARPDTRNMMGWLLPDDGPAPVHLADLPVGYSKLTSVSGLYSAAMVSEREGKRLVLEFDGANVSELATWFGLVPLVAVLVVLYLTTWLAYRVTRRAVSPVIRLAHDVENMDPGDPGQLALPSALPADTDHEVAVLSEALNDMVERVNALVVRERNFTRDASHELRSPITVVKLAADVMLANPALDEKLRPTVERIKRAAVDMSDLIDTLLLLAREADRDMPQELVDVNALLAEEAELARLLAQGKPVELVINNNFQLSVQASRKILSVLFGNLLRNAFVYTESGSVAVDIDVDSITIRDTGPGMTSDEVARAFEPFYRGPRQDGRGHGVGLSIVKRLSDRYGWPVSLESTPGTGTRIAVSLGTAVSLD